MTHKTTENRPDLVAATGAAAPAEKGGVSRQIPNDTADLAPSTTTALAPVTDEALEALLEGIAEVSKHVRNILFALVSLVAFVLLGAISDTEATSGRERADRRLTTLSDELNAQKRKEKEDAADLQRRSDRWSRLREPVLALQRYTSARRGLQELGESQHHLIDADSRRAEFTNAARMLRDTTGVSDLFPPAIVRNLDDPDSAIPGLELIEKERAAALEVLWQELELIDATHKKDVARVAELAPDVVRATAERDRLVEAEERSAVPLPLIGTPVKPSLFFVVGPWLVFLVFLYLRIYAGELKARALQFDLAADEQPRKWSRVERQHRIYPWLLNFARYGVPGARFVAGLAVDWMVPITLLALIVIYCHSTSPKRLVVASMVMTFTLAIVVTIVDIYKAKGWTSVTLSPVCKTGYPFGSHQSSTTSPRDRGTDELPPEG